MTRVAGVFLRSHDPEALAAFYGALLGLRFRALPDGTLHAGRRRGLQVGIQPSRPTPVALRALGLTLEVPSLDQALAPLLETPLVRGRWESSEGRFAMVFDPDGNELCLFERARATRRPRHEAGEAPGDEAGGP